MEEIDAMKWRSSFQGSATYIVILLSYSNFGQLCELL